MMWLPVPDWEGLYEVSDSGHVRSVRSNRIISTCGLKYLEVSLWRSGRRYYHNVHVLVARAFLGECPPGQEVRHLNDDRSDNRLVNLEYGTRSQNMHDLVRNGRCFNSSKTHCPKGHAYDEENTYINPSSGSRMCRVCIRERDRARSRSKISRQ